MAKIQGDFQSEAIGHAAVEALTASGIPRDRIRIWNLIPDGGPSRTVGSSLPGAAATGLVLGGLPGLAAGAAIGSVFDAGNDDGPHLPLPSGVSVVVDTADGDGNARETLKAHGATNIRTLS